MFLDEGTTIIKEHSVHGANNSLNKSLLTAGCCQLECIEIEAENATAILKIEPENRKHKYAPISSYLHYAHPETAVM